MGKKARTYTDLDDVCFLCRHYLIEQRSLRVVGEMAGGTFPQNVRLALDQHGISARPGVRPRILEGVAKGQYEELLAVMRVAAAAAELGVSVGTFISGARAAGVDIQAFASLRARSIPHRTWSPLLRDKAKLAAAVAVLSDSAIARQEGCHRTTVAKARRFHGIERTRELAAA